MKNFLVFLSEQYLTEENKYIPHLSHLAGEEHFFSRDRGLEDVNRMDELASFLKGKNSTNVKTVGVKADGSPAFEMGHVINPKTNQREFGVAYKGAAKGFAFNQDEVNEKFGHSEGLRSKMSQLLEHGGKIMSPLHGIVQGDFMGSHKDGTIQSKGSKITHKENTIEYGYDKNSTEGKAIARAKISIAPHTRTRGENGIEYNIDTSKFYPSDDVHIFNNKFNRSNAKFQPEDQEEYESELAKGKNALEKIKDVHDGLVEGHSEHLQTYINKTVREGSIPTAAGYREHLSQKLQKEVDKVKTVAAKQRKQDYHDNMIYDVDENMKHFNTLFKAHGHLEKARDTLLRTLENAGQNQEHRINGMLTNPEGFVASFKDGSARKIVNRSKEGFSGLNLNK